MSEIETKAPELDTGKREGDDRTFTINFGPQHPAAHGVLRLCLNSTAKWSSASILISVCFTAARRS